MKLETKRWFVDVPDSYYQDVIDMYSPNGDIDYIIEQVSYDIQNALQWSLDSICDDDWYEECLRRYENNEFFESELDTHISKIVVKTCWLDEPETYMYGEEIAEHMRDAITKVAEGKL